MTINPGPLWTDAQTRAVAAKRHCFQTLQFLYGDAVERMTSPEAVADLTKWRRLGRQARAHG